jgi:hypothetical protein
LVTVKSLQIKRDMEISMAETPINDSSYIRLIIAINNEFEAQHQAGADNHSKGSGASPHR